MSTDRPVPAPRLAVLVVVGQRRERAQRVLDAVAGQTCADALELVVADTAPDVAPLRLPANVPSTHLALSRDTPFGAARAAALRHSTAELVAFVEDHCYPSRGWAEALLRAHQGPWAAVGYAFTNPNPHSYMDRASMMFDYGIWAHPVRGGPARLLPYNNVSYKRAALLALGEERLDLLLGTDFHVHRELLRRGQPLYMAADALAAHENFARLSGLLSANHNYSRKLAADRVANGRWGLPRRLFWGLTTPFGAPLISLWRRLSSLRGRPSLWGEALISLPVMLVGAVWTAVGEALGYLLGEGRSGALMSHWEVDARRTRPR